MKINLPSCGFVVVQPIAMGNNGQKWCGGNQEEERRERERLEQEEKEKAVKLPTDILIPEEIQVIKVLQTSCQSLITALYVLHCKHSGSTYNTLLKLLQQNNPPIIYIAATVSFKKMPAAIT